MFFGGGGGFPFGDFCKYQIFTNKN